MSKNIILQHFDGELRELDKLSMENIKVYAESVGADYQLVTGKPFREHLTSPCQKVFMIDEKWDEYDQVLMLDIDMFATKKCPDIFTTEKGIGLYNPIQQGLHRKIVNQYGMQSSRAAPYWGGAIYKIHKHMRQSFRKCLGGNEQWMNAYNQPYHFEDEGIFHTLAMRAGIGYIPTMNMDPRWCYDNYLPEPESAYMIHIRTKIAPNGPKQEKIKNYQEMVKRGVL